MARDADSTSRGEQLHLGQIAVGHRARGIAVVTMRGEHDLGTQPVLAQALALAATHSNVVIDLSECSFIDSTVIREFTKTLETVRAKGEQVMLVIPAEQAGVARIAEVVGLEQIFELHETLDGAVARLEEAERNQPPGSIMPGERAGSVLRRRTQSTANGRAGHTHEIRVRDRRARFGDPEIYAAECTCGWTSEPHSGQQADRAARRAGLAHIEAQLPPYGHRAKTPG